jgi:hypothetical protein
MKLLSVFLLSVVFLQSVAWAGPKDNLKTILDEYRYAVTVEWDQQDKAQLAIYQAQFSKELKGLVEEQNFSAKDLKAFIKENTRNLQIDETAFAVLEDKNGNLNLERVQQLLEDSSRQIYMQGSSWTAKELLIGGLIFLIVAEIVVLIITARDDKCPNPEYHPNDIPYPCIYE